ncbi:hypothetical protein [Rossellomorea marisflavi]|uniref:hypothetical protein n=1 Tax=Rossellomorea marisflavi TaxID=189381 RepID=UPI003F9FA6A1
MNSAKGYVTYKGRTLDSSKKVRLYRNLNNGKISIKQGSLVVGHTDMAMLQDAQFLVFENGRQRVLKEKQKNVHAYIEGYWSDAILCEQGRKVWYNPYKTDHFMSQDDNTPCIVASYVKVESSGAIEMWT